MALGTDCSSYWSDILNPACWLQDPMGIQPSLSIDQATCTSGTLEQQAACQAGVVAAQNQANSNPAYACAMSSFQIPCMLGLTDASGNINNWVWAVIGIGAGIFFLRRVK